MSFGLVPEVLDTVDMISFSIDKLLGMVDPMMPELGNIQHVVAGVSVGVNDAVGFDRLPDNRL